jgi:hypothetical protein
MGVYPVGIKAECLDTTQQAFYPKQPLHASSRVRELARDRPARVCMRFDPAIGRAAPNSEVPYEHEFYRCR